MKRYIKKQRDVATCDGCGRLLLAYGNPRDLEDDHTRDDRGLVTLDHDELQSV